MFEKSQTQAETALCAQRRSQITQKQMSRFSVPVRIYLISSPCFKYFVRHCNLLTPFFMSSVCEPKTSHKQFPDQQH